MEAETKARFIYLIQSEKQYNVLVRIVAALNRERIPIIELNSQLLPETDQLRITFSVEQTKNNALKLSRKINKEIDVINVQVFEQLN